MSTGAALHEARPTRFHTSLHPSPPQELSDRSPYLAAVSRMAVYETRKVGAVGGL